jgi:hypothetical protein
VGAEVEIILGPSLKHPATPPSHLFAVLPYLQVTSVFLRRGWSTQAGGGGDSILLRKAIEHAVCRPSSDVALGSPRIMPVTHLTHAL